MTTPVLHREATAAAACEAVARFLAEELGGAVRARGRARIALAGGSTPKAAYERLAAPDLAGLVPWPRVEVFFGDERLVPPDDPSSNFRMARVALLDRVPIPAENVHRISGELSAAEATARYAAVVGDAPLDVVLLGMGDDGHVASLFPRRPELDSPDSVVPSTGPVAPTARVTLGFSVLNAARVVALLVTGSGKAERLAEAYAELETDSPLLPVSRVRAGGGRYHWFFDTDAGARLPASARFSPMEERR
ncbi:MAG TPA: 6-phosphogluconolactonase [Polyangiaceae bacterium]|nr:6-phosphogluconolactonase [Polyangiaceae bacterium]